MELTYGSLEELVKASEKLGTGFSRLVLEQQAVQMEMCIRDRSSSPAIQ